MKVTDSNQLIKDRRESANEMQRMAMIAYKHKAKLTATTRFLNRLLDRFDKEEHHLAEYTWLDVSTWHNSVTLEINLSAPVLSMKEGLVPTLCRVLMNANFEIKRTEDYANEHRGQRAFEFRREKTDDYVEVKLRFEARTMDDEKATCRRVQTGVKVTEVPVYELQCPEATAEEIASA